MAQVFLDLDWTVMEMNPYHGTDVVGFGLDADGEEPALWAKVVLDFGLDTDEDKPAV